MRELHPAPQCWFCCSLPGQGTGRGGGKGSPEGYYRESVLLRRAASCAHATIVGSRVFIACSNEPKCSSRQCMGGVVVAVWGIL